MASIENKSRTQVSVKNRDDLTKLFPYNKAKATAAYIAELKQKGHHPDMTVLDESYLVRFKVDGKRVSALANTAEEAETIKLKVELDQRQSVLVDFTQAHKLSLADLLIRYVKEEAPRLKGFLITAYQVNTWLEDADLPRLDVAAIHAAHPNPQNPGLHIPRPSGKRMSDPNEAARFIRNPFAKIGPVDFTRYVDERVESVETSTADRELDIIRRVCTVAMKKWRIHVNCDPFHGYERPVGHLRDEKDPLTLMAAARRLDGTAGLRILHIGAALDPQLGDEARRTMHECPHYRWLEGLPAAITRRWIARSRALVHMSKLEGGAHAVIEAVRSKVPVLASRIDGNVGLLGEGYEGFFPVGDAAALATIMRRFQAEPAYAATLQAQCAERERLFAPAAEARALRALLKDMMSRTSEVFGAGYRQVIVSPTQ